MEKANAILMQTAFSSVTFCFCAESSFRAGCFQFEKVNFVLNIHENHEGWGEGTEGGRVSRCLCRAFMCKRSLCDVCTASVHVKNPNTGSHDLKQNKAQHAYAESTHKGVNEHLIDH